MEKGREGQRQTQKSDKKHFMFLAAAKIFYDVDDFKCVLKILVVFI